MTIYFRPDRIEYSYPTTVKQSFNKDDHQIYNITLTIIKILEDKTTKLVQYNLDQVNHDFLHKNNFIGLSAKGQFQLVIAHKDPYTDKQTLTFNFNEQISNFKGCKNDLFTKQIQLGNYRITCTYGYNKFLQVCGMSKFYEFTIEPTGIVAEKIRKMKHDTFISASKGLMSYDEKVNKHQYESNLVKNKQKVQQHTAFKEDQAQQEQDDHLKILNKPAPTILFNNGEEQISKHQKVKTNEKVSKDDLKFYKGACKTANFFSCLDPRPNVDKEYHFIEQSYN